MQGAVSDCRGPYDLEQIWMPWIPMASVNIFSRPLITRTTARSIENLGLGMMACASPHIAGHSLARTNVIRVRLSNLLSLHLMRGSRLFKYQEAKHWSHTATAQKELGLCRSGKHTIANCSAPKAPKVTKLLDILRSALQPATQDAEVSLNHPSTAFRTFFKDAASASHVALSSLMS